MYREKKQKKKHSDHVIQIMSIWIRETTDEELEWSSTSKVNQIKSISTATTYIKRGKKPHVTSMATYKWCRIHTKVV